MRARVLLVTLATTTFGGAACTQYVFEPRLPESVKEVNRIIPAMQPKPADILFVVDNSGSMDDEQDNLARNFDRFINVLSKARGDYQLAVVTTDINDRTSYERAGLQAITRHDASRSYYVEYDRTGGTCQDTSTPHGCIRGANAQPGIIRSGELTSEQQIAAFKANVKVGSCGDSNERGLGAMIQALDNTRSGRCNAGFLRRDANLVVVLVSDEDDHSDGSGDNPPLDVSQWPSRLLDYKDASQIRVAAIVGSKDGRAARCGQTAACGSLCETPNPPTRDPEASAWSPNTCWSCAAFSAPDCCSARPGRRYVAFANLMDEAIRAKIPAIPDRDCSPPPGERAACLVDSICQEEFADTLQRIAQDLVVENAFTLDPAANDPESIVVIVTQSGMAPNRLRRCANATDTNCDFFVVVDTRGRDVEIKLREPVAERGTIELYYTTEESLPE